jgi:hypothetical protein
MTPEIIWFLGLLAFSTDFGGLLYKIEFVSW